MRKLIFAVMALVLLYGAIAWAADLDDGVMRLLLMRSHKRSTSDAVLWPGTTDAMLWPGTTDKVLWP